MLRHHVHHMRAFSGSHLSLLYRPQNVVFNSVSRASRQRLLSALCTSPLNICMFEVSVLHNNVLHVATQFVSISLLANNSHRPTPSTTGPADTCWGRLLVILPAQRAKQCSYDNVKRSTNSFNRQRRENRQVIINAIRSPNQFQSILF